jgi:Flp pilus assembly protein CpaB
MVEVIVAAKDLPVGTMFTVEDLKDYRVVKTKKVPKDDLPPTFITNRRDLMDRRLSRPVRAGETFNPQDLNKGGSVGGAAGYRIVSLELGAQGIGGDIGPGSRLNVLATLRDGNKLSAFPLLVNMLVVAVDTHVPTDQKGAITTRTVSFPVFAKQELALELAKARGYSLELQLRHPTQSDESDNDYDINKIIKLLSPEPEPAIEVAPPPRPAVDPIPPASE